MPQPLEGYRVLDMTEVWAGPMGTTLLGDLGAEVIRVESYPRASMTRPVQLATMNPAQRAAIPGDPDRPWDLSTTYHLANRNKLGVTLNVMHPRGRLLLERLVAVSDAFVIGYSAGTIDRMGLDYESLRKVREDLVMVSMPGWGERGPYKGYATLGSGLDAFTGHMYLRGYPDSDPTTTPVGVFHSDATGALLLAFAIMTALHYRERTGKGQYIDLSQAEVLLTHLPRPVLEWSMNGRVAQPLGNSDPTACPHGVFPCREEGSWIAIAVRADDQWPALVKAMGEPEWARQPELRNLLGRLEQRDAVERGVAEWTRSRGQDEAAAWLRAAGVPAGPVYDIPSLLQDPHLRERGFWITADHPPANPYERAGVLWRMSETPSEVRLATNNLGEHNREVFSGLLGLPEEDLAALEAEGVIGERYYPGAEIDTD
ncbi:MAG TPA: CoA transferase [Dehalococcoidia bacterium]|nr:CoA transferase [Dehalococcoidia bacterium]